MPRESPDDILKRFEQVKREMETARERQQSLIQIHKSGESVDSTNRSKGDKKRKYFHLHGEPLPNIYGFHYWKRQERLTGIPLICVYSDDIRRIGHGGYTNLPGWFYRLAF